MHYQQKRKLWGFIFVLPGIIFFGVFYLYPIIKGFWMSLHKWDIVGTPKYIGIYNYQSAFSDMGFVNATNVSLRFILSNMVIVFLLALGIAMLFNRRFRGKSAYMAAYFIPAVVAMAAAAVVWRIIYQPNYGVLTLVTDPLGFRNIKWLNSFNFALPAIILVVIWKSVPVFMVIFLAALGSISSSFVEAAKIDGGNRLQIFYHITMPLLKPVMLFVIVISMIWFAQEFACPYIMTRGGPGSATRVLPLLIYETAFRFLHMGYASALSVLLFAVLFVLSVGQLKLGSFGKEI